MRTYFKVLLVILAWKGRETGGRFIVLLEGNVFISLALDHGGETGFSFLA